MRCDSGKTPVTPCSRGAPAVTAKAAVRTVGNMLREHMTLVLLTQNHHNDKHRKDSRGPGLHVTLPPSTYVCDP